MNKPDNIVDYLSGKGIICSEQQKKAILSGQTDTLLLAVPGSGKTTVLVSRIAQMLCCEGYRPEQITALTYNRSAARDIGRRFEALFGDLNLTPPQFSTVHSLCWRILHRYAKAYHRNIPTLLDGSRYELRPQTLIRQAASQQTDSFLSAEQLDDLLSRIGQDVNRMKKSKESVSGCKLDVLAEDYQSLKQQRGVMDYDDMQTYALSILTKLPEFRRRVTDDWKWIFLDEAQDASLLQHKLLSLLAQGKQVFFVGDEDQTIYDFRGASPKQLLAFPKQHPDAQVMRLETNYRCPADLVSAADLLIRYNQNRFQKNMKAFRTEQNSIQVELLSDYKEQTDAVIRALGNLPRGKTAAVLAAHNVSLLPIALELSGRGVPYIRRDRDFRFSSNPAVRGFVQILSYAAMPNDMELFESAAKALWFRRTDVTQMKQYLRRFPNGFYSGMVCDLSKYEKKHAAIAAEAFSLMAKQNGAQIYDTVMEKLRYANCLAGKGKSADDLPPGIALALYRLRTVAEQSKNLSAFLLLLSKIEEFESLPANQQSGRITLTTIHGAKGLEFDEVYLLDAIEGCLPSFESEEASAAQRKENMEQQTRLFYVAITRARQNITLYSAAKYWENPVKPSRFISQALEKKGSGSGADTASGVRRGRDSLDGRRRGKRRVR